MVNVEISGFTSKVVQLAKNAVGERGEVAAPKGDGGFAEYAVVSLHCLRVYLEKSHREALDLLSEMPQILGDISLNAADLPDHSTLVKWFDRIETPLCRVLLRLSAIARSHPGDRLAVSKSNRPVSRTSSGSTSE